MSGRRIAFVSPFSLIDHASGAAIATWRGLELLCGTGFQCQAFCAARLDAGEEVCFGGGKGGGKGDKSHY